MNKVIIIYASMSGNTESMAELIAGGIREQGVGLTMKEAMDTDVSDLVGFDGIIFGSYTWDDGELPDEFLDLFEDLDQLNWVGKKAAVFGSCDSSYDSYGAAVDTLMEKLQDLGAEVVLDGLKIELMPKGKEKELCKNFGISFVKHLLSSLSVRM